MSTPDVDDTYVYHDLPTVPASEVIVETVHAEPLPPTGYDPTGGLLIALSLILVGAIGLASSRVMIATGRARTKAAKK